MPCEAGLPIKSNLRNKRHKVEDYALVTSLLLCLTLLGLSLESGCGFDGAEKTKESRQIDPR